METGIMGIHFLYLSSENKRKIINAHFSGSEEFHALGHLKAIADQVLQGEGVLVEIIQV